LWLQPVSPLRNAYNQIRVGMNVAQVAEVLKRCGWSKYDRPWLLYGRVADHPTDPTYSLVGAIKAAGMERVDDMQLDTLMYQGASGETLTIRWEGPWDWDRVRDLTRRGHVVGKVYDSGIDKKLRDWWDRLRAMLRW
jgi:hypothetical protein